MSRPRSPAPPWRRLLDAATWSLLLGGLLAMHGLAGHGVAHHNVHNAVPASLVVAHDHAGAGHTSTATDSDRESGHEESDTMAAGLCLALLAGIAAALWLRLSANQRPMSSRSPRLPTVWLHRSQRDPDPPCLFTLSILRC